MVVTMETKDIRLQNMMILLEKYPSKQSFADHVEMAPAHVSQIVNGFRDMGNMIARRIEEKEGLPLGYMDSIHNGQENHSNKASKNAVQKNKSEQNNVTPIDQKLIDMILDAIDDHLKKTGQTRTSKEIYSQAMELYNDFVDVKETLTKPVLAKILKMKRTTG